MSNTPHLKLEAFPFSIAMWEHINDNGYPYYTGSLQKARKDKETGKWERDSMNLTARDFLAIAALLLRANEKLNIQEIEQQEFVSDPKITTSNVEAPW